MNILNRQANSSHWFILYTASRAEKKVAERLAQDGYQVYLPLHKERKKWSDRIKVVEVPLFNSYLFVHCTQSKLPYVCSTPGVSHPVYHDHKPAVIREKDLKAIEEFLKLAEEKKIIRVGDTVEMDAGPLKSARGKVLRIARGIATLRVDILNATLKVELDSLVRPLDKPTTTQP